MDRTVSPLKSHVEALTPSVTTYDYLQVGPLGGDRLR